MSRSAKQSKWRTLGIMTLILLGPYFVIVPIVYGLLRSPGQEPDFDPPDDQFATVTPASGKGSGSSFYVTDVDGSEQPATGNAKFTPGQLSPEPLAGHQVRIASLDEIKELHVPLLRSFQTRNGTTVLGVHLNHASVCVEYSDGICRVKSEYRLKAGEPVFSRWCRDAQRPLTANEVTLRS